jgi:hypothetical protein
MTDEQPRPVQTLIDPTRSSFITIVGRKGSGKSTLAARFFATYPYDRLAIDPMHDAHVPEDTERVTAPLPPRWPTSTRERTSLHFMPDPGSPTYKDDLDRAVGMAFAHRRTCCWIDEVGELTNAHNTPPNMRRALQTGRHRALTLVMCTIRPIDVNPLVISQADYLYVFQLPHPRDVDRVAGVAGIDPRELDAALRALPKYGHLRYESDTGELVEFPPLPRGAPRPIPEHDDAGEFLETQRAAHLDELAG